LVIGWFGATSASVRAIAIAVSGRRLDDDVGAGDHRTQDGHRRDQSAVARRDMQDTRSECAHAQLASVAQLVRDPSVEVVQPDLTVGDFGDIVPGKQRPQNAIAVLHHFRRQHVGHQRGLIGFLQVGVRLEVQRVAESFEHIEDLVEGQLVEVAHLRGAAQRQLLDVLAHVRRLESRRADAGIERHQVIGDDPPSQEQRDGVSDHKSRPFMKSTASLCTSCVAAQVIRSSSTPSFSL
jgi:hypothetical protein